MKTSKLSRIWLFAGLSLFGTASVLALNTNAFAQGSNNSPSVVQVTPYNTGSNAANSSGSTDNPQFDANAQQTVKAFNQANSFQNSQNSNSSTADNVIVISKSFLPIVPVSIGNFTYSGDPLPNDFRVETIIGDDLQHTGLFNPVYPDRFPQDIAKTPIDPSLWNARNLNYLVVGSVNNKNGQITVTYKLFSIAGTACKVGTVCATKTFTVSSSQPRLAAHETAQQIFADIQKKRASFTGKLAYVAQPTLGVNKYQLVVADYDGYNPRVIYTSNTPIMGTNWGPVGNNVVFSVYGTFRTRIINYNIPSGTTTELVNHLGNNNAPSYSPDGNYLAYSGGYNGVYDIYTLNLNTNKVSNLTRGVGYNTEPSWYGNTLIFTSTRGGSGVPAIYQMNLNGTNIHRISKTTGETTDASVNPAQKYLAMINNNRVTIQNLATGSIANITDTFLDESVHSSYYGNMLVYSATDKYSNNKFIYIVSENGNYQGKLPFQSKLGMYTSPSWSRPLISK